jgi:tetratricopeptide (TPR) repeat protein
LGNLNKTAEISVTGEIVQFPSAPKSVPPEVGRELAERILSVQREDRRRIADLGLEQSEVYLSLCLILDSQLESAPSVVLAEAEYFYELLQGKESSAFNFLFDEHDYYCGEFAILAGTSCRMLGRREEAHDWFDRADVEFLATSNAIGDVARTAYQRLAVKIEERKFDQVLTLAPGLGDVFSRLHASESALKTRCLLAVALQETERREEALELYRSIAKDAESLASARVLSSAWVNITQILALQGKAEEALQSASHASGFLRTTGFRSDVGKLQLGIAYLLRNAGKRAEALEAYRSSQREFSALGMRADVAAVHLVIADLLLELGQEAQAEWEIRAALPVIDELKMVPEGVAALSLLRESVRRRKIDRQALRDLHGYFDEIQG